MYAQVFGAVGGFTLSLLFSYIPGFKTWFDNLDKKHGPENGSNYKRLIMAALPAALNLALNPTVVLKILPLPIARSIIVAALRWKPWMAAFSKTLLFPILPCGI